MTYSIYSISTQDGVVLYVGMSINVEKRFSKHRTNRIVSQYAPVSFAVLATRKSKQAALRCEHANILKYKRKGQCLLNVQCAFPLSVEEREMWEANSIEQGIQHRPGTVKLNVLVHKKDLEKLQARLASQMKSVAQFIREAIRGYLSDN